MEDLKHRTVRGGLAKLFGQAANFLLRIGFIVVLSRLLDPEDFGLVAMATVVTGIYGMFTTAGLSAATVQKADITDAQISALFWVNILVGAALGVLCLVTAPVLVAFYHEPRLFWVTVAMAAGFLITSAGVQHSALLQRQLRYVAITAIEISSQLAGVAVGVGMAVAGSGYWALVASTLVAPAVATACAWLVTAWIPGRPRRDAGIGSMLRFGGTMTINSLVVYVAYNFDKLLLGRVWGADALGIYSRAYQLISIPTDNLNAAIGGIAFSALSRVQDNPSRLRNYFLKGYALVVSITLPLNVFCALFAEDIVLVLLGPKWKDAAAIFRTLTPMALIISCINPTGWLLFSLGRVARSLKIAFVIAPLVMGACVIGLPNGPQGVAAAYSTAMTLWLVPHIIWSLHGTPISPWDLLVAAGRPMLAAIVAALLALVVQFHVGQLESPLLRLALGGSVMAATYTCILMFALGQRHFYLDLLKGLRGSPSSI